MKPEWIIEKIMAMVIMKEENAFMHSKAVGEKGESI
jgi:hypothetical protein